MSQNDRNPDEDSGRSLLSLLTDKSGKNNIKRLAAFFDTEKKEICKLLDNVVEFEQTEYLPLKFEQAIYHWKESEPVQRVPLTLDSLQKVKSVMDRISQDKVFFEQHTILEGTAKSIKYIIKISSNQQAEDKLNYTKTFDSSPENKEYPQQLPESTNDANGEHSYLEMSRFIQQNKQYYANDSQISLANEGQDSESREILNLQQSEEAAGHSGLGQGAASQETSNEGPKGLLQNAPEEAESFGL